MSVLRIALKVSADASLRVTACQNLSLTPKLGKGGRFAKVSTYAWVAELVDARDLKSLIAKSVCEFDSRPRHQKCNGCLQNSQPLR